MHGHVPFYQLRNVEGAPRLPADYSTMLLAALVPPLWFIIMNPRVRPSADSSVLQKCSVLQTRKFSLDAWKNDNAAKCSDHAHGHALRIVL